MANTVLHRTGDVDPITYGGGVVLEWGEGPVWFCWNTADDFEEDETFEVHEIPVPASVTEQYDWIDLDPVADSAGQDPDEFRKCASSKNLAERVYVLETIVGHWGAFELSQCPPTTFTKKELLDLCEFDEDEEIPEDPDEEIPEDPDDDIAPYCYDCGEIFEVLFVDSRGVEVCEKCKEEG